MGWKMDVSGAACGSGASLYQDRQIIASRSRRLWTLLGFWGSPRVGSENVRSAECMSGSAFHNAFRGLEPGRHSVGPGLFPAGWHRRESSLLALALETEPTLAVFTGDSLRSSERSPPALGSSPPVERSLIRCASARGRPPVSSPSLSRSGGNQPHFPSLAL